VARRIDYMPNENVCMFWVVDNNLWLEKTPLDLFRNSMSNFNQRSVITFREAHFRTWGKWCAKYQYNQKEEHFMYHPRGRVSYFPRVDKYELVIDPCLINSDFVDIILEECGITRDNTSIVIQSDDQTLHYICHKCRPEIFNDKRSLKPDVVL
jgi:hypothetical protein